MNPTLLQLVVELYNLQDDLTIHDSAFIGNYAKIKNGILQGGAIANYANNLTVDNCSFVKNHLFNTNGYKNGKCMVELFITPETI